MKNLVLFIADISSHSVSEMLKRGTGTTKTRMHRNGLHVKLNIV